MTQVSTKAFLLGKMDNMAFSTDGSNNQLSLNGQNSFKNELNKYSQDQEEKSTLAKQDNKKQASAPRKADKTKQDETDDTSKEVNGQTDQPDGTKAADSSTTAVSHTAKTDQETDGDMDEAVDSYGVVMDTNVSLTSNSLPDIDALVLNTSVAQSKDTNGSVAVVSDSIAGTGKQIKSPEELPEIHPIINQGSNSESQSAKNIADAAGKKLDINVKPADSQKSGGDSSGNDQNASELKKLMEFESNRSGVNRFSKTEGAESSVKNEVKVETGNPQTSVLNQMNLQSFKSNLTENTSNVASQSTVDIKGVIDQIVQKAELMSNLNNSEMKLELKPEFLGKMTIKIMVNDGTVTARFTTDNADVKHILDTNLNILKQSLEQQGIKVQKAEVDVQLNNGGLGSGFSGQQDRWQQPGYANGNSNYQSTTDQPYESINSGELTTLTGQDNFGISDSGSMNFII